MSAYVLFFTAGDHLSAVKNAMSVSFPNIKLACKFLFKCCLHLCCRGCCQKCDLFLGWLLLVGLCTVATPTETRLKPAGRVQIKDPVLAGKEPSDLESIINWQTEAETRFKSFSTFSSQKSPSPLLLFVLVRHFRQNFCLFWNRPAGNGHDKHSQTHVYSMLLSCVLWIDWVCVQFVHDGCWSGISGEPGTAPRIVGGQVWNSHDHAYWLNVFRTWYESRPESCAQFWRGFWRGSASPALDHLVRLLVSCFYCWLPLVILVWRWNHHFSPSHHWLGSLSRHSLLAWKCPPCLMMLQSRK